MTKGNQPKTGRLIELAAGFRNGGVQRDIPLPACRVFTLPVKLPRRRLGQITRPAVQ